MGGSSNANASGDAPVTFDTLPPHWEPVGVVPRRPLGVAVLAVLIALFALVIVLAGLVYLLAAEFGSVVPTAIDLVPSIDLVGAVILVVLGAALLGIATSLWRQETWALWTTIVLVFLTTTYLFFTGSITVLFLLFVVVFVYLISVRRYFY